MNRKFTVPPIMLCGCAANGTTKDGDPICVIHVGMLNKSNVDIGRNVKVVKTNYLNRKAICGQCRKDHTITPSTPSLPFFREEPDFQFDSYYCGCRGWD